MIIDQMLTGAPPDCPQVRGETTRYCAAAEQAARQAKHARREALEEAERALRRKAHDLASAGHKHDALPWIEAVNEICKLKDEPR